MVVVAVVMMIVGEVMIAVLFVRFDAFRDGRIVVVFFFIVLVVVVVVAVCACS